MLLSVIVMRVNSARMRSFWPLVITELIKTFSQVRTSSLSLSLSLMCVVFCFVGVYHTLLSTFSQARVDAETALWAAKFIDVALLSAHEPFSLYSWIFLSDPAPPASVPTQGTCIHTIPVCLFFLLPRPCLIASAVSHPLPLYQPLLDQLGADASSSPAAPAAASAALLPPVPQTPRRPLLWHTSVPDSDHLYRLLSRFSSLAFANLTVTQAKLDMSEISRRITGDFIEREPLLDPADFQPIQPATIAAPAAAAAPPPPPPPAPASPSSVATDAIPTNHKVETASTTVLQPPSAVTAQIPPPAASSLALPASSSPSHDQPLMDSALRQGTQPT